MNLRILRPIILVLVVSGAFLFVKLSLKTPTLDIEIVGIILTVASILFGLLAGFFISELWTRYTSIRELQSDRTSRALSMIQYAGKFFRNEKFEKSFKTAVEKSAIADTVVAIDEGPFAHPYFLAIEETFNFIEVTNQKEEVYFDNLLDNYDSYLGGTTKADVLYRERLFISEWFILVGLSVIIAATILFLDTTSLINLVLISAFPAIIAVALMLVYDLDSMRWNREAITLDPDQIIWRHLGQSDSTSRKISVLSAHTYRDTEPRMISMLK